MSFSKFTKKDKTLVETARSEMMELAEKRCRNLEELSTVKKAFEFASRAYTDMRRSTKEPFIIHPLKVATIVIKDIGLGYKSITAAILHDLVDNTDISLGDIRNLFGDKIGDLVDGLSKIKTVLDNEDASAVLNEDSDGQEADNFKRILLTMGDDIRVVLIKLADRLQNCRSIESVPEYKREKILAETMSVFIPLAHRLGLYAIKSEMENIWLKYCKPEAYGEIKKRINLDVAQRSKLIEDFIAPISSALTEAGYRFEIKKRVKTPYSIWYKMNNKKVSFEEIYDLYAVRIIFEPEEANLEAERNQSYIIYATITKLYRDEPSRIRDWIRNPKSNGYEALHCTLMSNAGIWIEVQIRSRRMDDIAEKGIAAHWSYKQNGLVSKTDSSMENWLARVQEVLHSGDVDTTDLLDMLRTSFIANEIVVFTPKGDQRIMPKGSTALDFAYFIHSKIGEKAIAAKVNSKVVPLRHEIKSGDRIEIITARNARPKAEWMNFLKTRTARRKVLDYLREFHPEELQDDKNPVNGTRKKTRIRIEMTVDSPADIDTLKSCISGKEGVSDVTISNI